MKRSKPSFILLSILIDRLIFLARVMLSASEHRRSLMLFQMDGGWRVEMKAMEKLDALEEHMVKVPDYAEGRICPRADGVGAFVDTGAGDCEVKVRGTLLRHIEAWEAAGAGAFALGVIKEGFKLSMVSTPEAYEEDNNKSFKKDREFAIEAVQKLLKLEILKEVQRKEVTCVNPLTVAINGVGKRRLCIDLSRCVNEINNSYKFRIESTLKFLEVVKQGDWLFAFDLKSAYHQIEMFREHWKFLGLALEIDGVKKFFVFTCLPFGLNDAARALTKLLRFPLQRWRSWGIKAFVHLDDGIGAVRGRAEAQRASDVVKADLAQFGLMTSEDKCTWTVTQEIEWTGWRIDTREFMIYVPERKIVKAEEKLEVLLQRVGQVIKVKQLASVVGLIISFGLAVGRSARFYTRFSSIEVARAVEKSGWGAALVLSEEVLSEVRFWVKNLRELNGQRIRREAGVQVLQPRMLYSDAGGHMAGGCMIVNKEVMPDSVFQVNLAEDEVGKSSTYRELRGIEEGFKALGSWIKGRSVRWHCDNWSACKIVEYGSMKPDCHVVAKRINALIRELDVNFEIAWLSRESVEIRFADRISKDFDFGDYRLSAEDFDGLVNFFGGFSADYFASDYSFRMRPFFSRYISGLSAGCDAFAQDWSRGFGFFHPPVGLVPRLMDKAREDGAHLGGAGLAREHGGQGDQGLRGARAGGQMEAGV